MSMQGTIIQLEAENKALKLENENLKLAIKPYSKILAIAMDSSLSREQKVNRFFDYAEKEIASSANPGTP